MSSKTNNLKVRSAHGNHLYAEGLNPEQAALILLVLIESGYPSIISDR